MLSSIMSLLDKLNHFYETAPWAGNIVSSLALLLILLGVRALSIRQIQRWKLQSRELKRRWLVQVRNWSVLLFLFGMVVIWGAEIRTIALSMAALAVAAVIATKELILCFAGSFVKASTQAFRLGDRIEIQNCRGDVIDQNLMGTKLLEVGPESSGSQYTGRTILLPNSHFLQYPITNESLDEGLSIHQFDVTLSREIDENWLEAETILLEAARRVCQTFVPEAKKARTKISKKSALRTPGAEPRVTIELLPYKDVRLHVQVACPLDQRYRVQRAILERFKRRFFKGEDLKAIENDQS